MAAAPTDTLYGLAASIDHPAALARVLRIKRRGAGQGVPLLLASAAQLEQVARPTALSQRLTEAFWPGALTLVLPAAPGVDARLLGPGGTVGVRVPAAAVMRELIAQVGAPLTGPSANRRGAPPPASAQDALAAVGDAVDYVLDGGPAGGDPSTVLDLTSDPPRILRSGAVSAASLRTYAADVRAPDPAGP